MSLLQTARSGLTGDPDISNIEIARLINTALGGPFIAPWDVDQLTNDFIDTVRAMLYDLPAMVKHRKEVERKFEEWRKTHPNYRKN